MYRIVIPARFASMRLPGKVLLQIAGRSILEWVYRRAQAAGAAEIVVATDDERIAQAARLLKADVAMTATSHPSGTDRIAEVARTRGWPAEDIVVNLQGDEPLMPSALIEQVATLLAATPRADLATLSFPLADGRELVDPNVVKVVCDREGRALYFSRAPIPCNRDEPGVPRGAARHIGLYAYRVRALGRLTSLAPSPLETLEKLEQLRALENGMAIIVATATEAPGADVNTREDLDRAARQLRT